MHPARLLSLLAVVTTAAALLGATTTTAVVVVDNFTCSPEGNYTDNSPYGKNLDMLLSVMSTPAPSTVDNWWFRSLTVASDPGNNNASGLAMCYADADAAGCRTCLSALSPGASFLSYNGCNHSRNVSFLSSNGCVIRYADAPFFGSADRSGPRIVLRSTIPAFDAAGMREARGRLLSQLAETAGGAALRFATGSQEYVEATTERQRHVVYGMAQCTRDLPLSECPSCLIHYVAVMYGEESVINSASASVMGFSCYLRYQWNKPIDIDGLAQPPTADNPAGSSAPPPPVGKTTMLVAALALAAGVIITLFNA